MWLDDLTVRLQEGSKTVKEADSKFRQAVGDDIYNFISGQAKSAGVKIVPQLGNLSEEDLKKGARGQAPGIPVANTPMQNLQNSLQAAGISPTTQKIMMPLLLALAAFGIYVVFFKKSGRGRRG